jgi:hypothetical protein
MWYYDRKFFETASVFSCLYNSNNAPYCSSSASYSYRKNKGAKPGNLPKDNTVLEIGFYWIEKYFLLVCRWLRILRLSRHWTSVRA